MPSTSIHLVSTLTACRTDLNQEMPITDDGGSICLSLINQWANKTNHLFRMKGKFLVELEWKLTSLLWIGGDHWTRGKVAFHF